METENTNKSLAARWIVWCVCLNRRPRKKMRSCWSFQRTFMMSKVQPGKRCSTVSHSVSSCISGCEVENAGASQAQRDFCEGMAEVDLVFHWKQLLCSQVTDKLHCLFCIYQMKYLTTQGVKLPSFNNTITPVTFYFLFSIMFQLRFLYTLLINRE